WCAYSVGLSFKMRPFTTPGPRLALRAAMAGALLWSAAVRGQAAAQEMTQAAIAFLGTLDAPRRAEASLRFDSPARLDWSYVPGKRRGLPLERMTPASRAAVTVLLRTGLSERGLGKVEAIVSLEDVLRETEGWAGRDPGLYYVTVVGEPAERGAWGWRYEGHHLSLNWTLVDGQIAGSAPQFLGANPATLNTGPPPGARALAAEEDLARALVQSFDPVRRARAVLAAEAPRDIVTGNARRVAIEQDRGIPWRELDASQRGLLLSLIREYADAQTPAVAQARLAAIQGGLDRTVFAWMGDLRPREGHYYRIQGPAFLIEYDNTQNGANHIHCVWREFHGDWGEDALAEHYRTAAHHTP